MRERRRALSAGEREQAALLACRHLAALGLPRAHSRIALYLPMDGELDPAPIARLAGRRGCSLFAPVVTSHRARRMRFAPLAGRLRANRWGIDEPDPRGGIDGRWLDLVLLPCVAFDAAGNRLGMGAGFYDRHFAFLHRRESWRRPRLLGLAYGFQRVPALQRRGWDVPLDGMITDEGAVLLRRCDGESE